MIDYGLTEFDLNLINSIFKHYKLPSENLTKKQVLFLLHEYKKLEVLAKNKAIEGEKQEKFIFARFVRYLFDRALANYDNMLLLCASKGCITGDAKLLLPRDIKKYPDGVPLKELVDKGEIYVYSYNKDTKKLELKKSDGVEYVKTCDVYEIELITGEKITATEDHPFMLMDGTYKQLKDLVYNKKGKYKNTIYKNGKVFLTDRLRTIIPFVKNNDYFKIDYSRYGNAFKKNMIEYRFIYEQYYNEKLSLKDMIHHKNNNHFDNRIENLQKVTSREHHKIHNMEKYYFKKGNKICYATGYSTKKKDKIKNATKEFSKMCRDKRYEVLKRGDGVVKNKSKINVNTYTYGGIIKSITYKGKQKVYDVVNVRDNHNFIVNGFVVSNTGKSSTAIQMARAWCKCVGIRFDPKKHIAYDNADVQRLINTLPKFSPLIADEALRFISSEDWNKAENKELKKIIGQVRTKHLFFIMCFPLKISKVDKSYLNSYVDYWIELYDRGKAVVFLKDMNPSGDVWNIKKFEKLGHWNEFTFKTRVLGKYMSHPNYWMHFNIPRVPKKIYDKYLEVRESNVYNDRGANMSIQEIDFQKASLILTLRDIITRDGSLSINRIVKSIERVYKVKITKPQLKMILQDAEMLMEKNIENNNGDDKRK